MRQIFYFFLLCSLFSTHSIAQTLNQSAGWPNSNWTLTGTFDAGALIQNPTVSDANWSYDDDAAGSGSTDEMLLASPTIDLTAASNAGETLLTLDFNYNYNLGSIFDIEYFDADANSWVVWSALADNSSTTSNWCANLQAYTSPELDISGFSATQLSGFRYRFNYNASSIFGWGFCMDSPTISSAAPPTCLDVSDITIGTVTTTTANVSWTENGTATMYDLELVDVTAGGTVTGTPTVTGVSNPYTFTGLSPANQYQVYVRANCGAGDVSAFSGPVDFSTLCGTFSAPYCESFESDGSEGCWTVINANGDGDSWNLNYASNPNTGSEVAALTTDFNSGDDDDYLITPGLTTTGNERLKFQTRVQSSGEPNKFEVLLSTTGTDPEDFTVTLLPLALYDNISYQEITLDLSAYTGTVYVAFRVPPNDTDGWRLYIDDVCFEEIPSCVEVSDVSVAVGSSTTATVSFTENGTATMYDLELVDVTAGGTVTGTPTATGVSNPYTFTGLSPANQYQVYVRANCGAGDVSAFSGPVDFSTLCSTFSAPYCESFESDGSEGCWTVINANGDGDSWNLNYTFNTNSGSEVAALTTDFNNGDDDDYLITPGLTTTGNERLKFQTRVQSSGEPNKFEVLLSTTGTDPADFTVTLLPLALYDNTSYQEITLDLSAYTGTVFVAFRVPPNDTDGWRLYIDDVCFEEIPSCEPVTGVIVENTTATTADVRWTEVGTATTWDLYYAPTASAVTPDETTTPTESGITMNTGYTIDNLMAGTEYIIYVRADCGASGTSIWSAGTTFTTNTLVDCSGTPFTDSYCYNSDSGIDDDVFRFNSSDGSSLKLSFTAGTVESCCDELVVFDSDGTILYDATNGGNLADLEFISSGGSISWTIRADGSVSCQQSSGYTSISYSVECSTSSNDDCANATMLTKGEPVEGSTADAGDENAIASNCGGDPDDDVWYMVTADFTNTLTITVTGNSGATPTVEVFEGSDCNSLTFVQCFTGGTQNIAATAGNIYMIRIYDAATNFHGGQPVDETRDVNSFTIMVSGAALPAELLSFKGQTLERSNLITWATASEQNVSDFTVERSPDGRRWEALGSIAAAGESNEQVDYEFEDADPAQFAYYRLITTDFDGSFDISEMITLERAVKEFGLVNVAPNPATAQTTITYSTAGDETITLTLTDLNGREVYRTRSLATAGIVTQELRLDELPTGVYFLQLTNGDDRVIERIVKQ